MAPRSFPPSFLFGAGTSALQIEGALEEDGRGPSIWDHFTRPGPGGPVGNACDHYHRVGEDVALMRQLGLDAYRFSIAWPRILPSGRGQVNTRGLDFYSRLVDQLLEANIKPFATLYHWDMPAALGAAGGWCNRDSAHAFAELCDVVGRKLGDRVPYFCTLNEPGVVMFQGYVIGEHAPGQKHRFSFSKAMSVMHHLLLAHGLGMSALRSRAPAAKLGITNALCQVYPAGDSAKDLKAAASAQELNLLFLGPIGTGTYHKTFMGPLFRVGKYIQPGDMEAISQPVDFLGVNCYTGARVKNVRFSLLGYDGILPDPTQAECTDMGWEVMPHALHDVLMWLAQEFPTTRLFVTENGAAYRDVLKDGEVADPERISYLARHLAEVQRAIDSGCPVDGYFAWSLLDNFEWTHGYAKRFGLVHVDYATQARTIKQSGYWYRDLCRARALP